MLAARSLIVAALSLAIAADRIARAEPEHYPPGVTAAYLLRLRGFIADEFSIVTRSGYVLTITRGRSPLFEKRLPSCQQPILFLHGVLGNANNFLLNSFNVQPKDLSGLDFNTMSMDEAVLALEDEPSAKALPFLALNRGCEVWLLARRGTPGSQQRLGDPLSVKATPTNEANFHVDHSRLGSLVGSLAGLLNVSRTTHEAIFTLDVSFWFYSLDEQSAEDFPDAINFVLSRSPGASQVSIVGHSAGGAMTLMGLSLMSPEMRQKVAVAVLWAPSYATSNDNPKFKLLFGPLVPVASAIVGPLLLPPFLVKPFISTLQVVCAPPETWTTLCEVGFDQVFGASGGEQPMRPQFIDFGPYAAASHELAQLGQAIFYPPDHTVRKFDFGPLGNLFYYGSLWPRAYSLGDIGHSPKLSFYAGPTDFLVTAADVQKARDQLKVASEFHVPNTTFNHIGYFNHIRNAVLAIIPSMYEIQTLAR